MILINQKQLTSDALNDKSHPLHAHAVEYNEGLTKLKEKFGKEIKFIRPGYPKFNPGADSEGRATDLLEPTQPALFPLQTYVTHPMRGRELIGCCLGIPKLLPNNLWDIGDKRSFTVFDSISVNIDNEPDLAYYIYYISRAVKRSELVVEDLKSVVRAKADKEREETERQMAIWHVLSDDLALRRIAQAYNIAEVGMKEDDAVRLELKDVLIRNDERKKLDPTVKGTKEFLEELKVSDNIRLRAFIRELLDKKVITYNPDGRFWLGDKVRELLQVPYSALGNTFDYICNFYGSPNNEIRLQQLMREVVTEDMLKGIVDDKDFVWLAKVMGVQTSFKKKEETKRLVYDAFAITQA